MKGRILLIWLLVAGLAIPVAADWRISNVTERSDQEIIVDGSLIVNGSGDLTLNNVTLKINGGFNVRVEEGGELFINNSRVLSAGSNGYGFYVYPMFVSQRLKQ